MVVKVGTEAGRVWLMTHHIGASKATEQDIEVVEGNEETDQRARYVIGDDSTSLSSIKHHGAELYTSTLLHPPQCRDRTYQHAYTSHDTFPSTLNTKSDTANIRDRNVSSSNLNLP